MNICAVLGGKQFGGYDYKDLSLEVSYDGWVEEDGLLMDIDFKHDKVASKELEKILLGRKSPCSLKDGSETIVYKGERIARLHLGRIQESWYFINFAKTPWAQAIDDLKRSAHRRRLASSLRHHAAQVRVDFTFNEHEQKGGHFMVSAAVARWLGVALLLAANGGLEATDSRIKVKENMIRANTRKLRLDR